MPLLDACRHVNEGSSNEERPRMRPSISMFTRSIRPEVQWWRSVATCAAVLMQHPFFQLGFITSIFSYVYRSPPILIYDILVRRLRMVVVMTIRKTKMPPMLPVIAMSISKC